MSLSLGVLSSYGRGIEVLSGKSFWGPLRRRPLGTGGKYHTVDTDGLQPLSWKGKYGKGSDIESSKKVGGKSEIAVNVIGQENWLWKHRSPHSGLLMPGGRVNTVHSGKGAVLQPLT